MIAILTFQDFEAATDRIDFIRRAINEHRDSDEYKTAVDAELYDRQQNVTINSVVRKIYNSAGVELIDPTASNNRIASNFFHRLLTQRVTYSLGNGVSFTDHVTRTMSADGKMVTVDETKQTLGDDFDNVLFNAAYNAERDGASYVFMNHDSVDGWTGHCFKFTEYVPLLDEYDSIMRAGIRYWSLDWERRPVTAVLYEADGYTTYRTKPGSRGLDLEEYEPKRAYMQIVQHTDAEGETVIGEENYTAGLPVVPFYGKHHQSAIVGLRAAIDSYDMIQSGFANDISDCAQIYWLIGNALGMDENDRREFRERLILEHLGVYDSENSSVTPYTQDVPYAAREAYLNRIADRMYKDFGAFNPETVTAGDITATQIKAAYQTQDEEADEFEYRCIQFLRRVLELIGVEDMPKFKRNMIANQHEQTQMIISAAEYLDTETILSKLPWISVDEVDEILSRRGEESESRLDDEEDA